MSFFAYQGARGFPGVPGTDGATGQRGRPGPRGAIGDRGPVGQAVKYSHVISFNLLHSKFFPFIDVQFVTLELGSIEGITLTCCARRPFPSLFQQRRRRLRERHLKSEVALPQTLSRLFHLV